MSIEVENQIKHSNCVDEPYLPEFRFLSENEVIIYEYYKEKNPLIKSQFHYYLLKLDPIKSGFVEKTKLTQKQYCELYERSYESLEDLKMFAIAKLVRK